MTEDSLIVTVRRNTEYEKPGDVIASAEFPDGLSYKVIYKGIMLQAGNRVAVYELYRKLATATDYRMVGNPNKGRVFQIKEVLYLVTQSVHRL